MTHIGLNPSVAAKILSVRRGKDGREGTSDDYIFRFPHDLIGELGVFVTLEVEEIENINQLVNENKLTTRSFYYRINVEAKLTGSQDEGDLLCVFNIQEKEIVYLRQRF